MKAKSRNLIISFLLMIAMLLGVFAMTPLTASAVSITPDEITLFSAFSKKHETPPHTAFAVWGGAFW